MKINQVYSLYYELASRVNNSLDKVFKSGIDGLLSFQRKK
jgi:hypothetical protein